MSLSKYISAKWNTPAFAGEQPTINAIGDDGLTYTIPSIDSDTSPWPEFLAEGGVVAPAGGDDAATEQQIISAPDDLFGGPTLGEIYHGN